MKEKALEIRKTILPMKDAYDELEPEDISELKRLQKEHDEIYASLSEEEKKWYADKFGAWYEQYLDMEAKVFIKPCEG